MTALLNRATDTPRPSAPLSGEWRRVLVWSSGVMLATSVPYLIVWLATPPRMEWAGVLYNFDDYVYYSWMLQAEDGHFFLRNLFTSEPQLGRNVHVFFWLLGTVARLTSLPIVLVYHLGRILAGGVALALVYTLTRRYIQVSFARGVVYWLTALSAGFGWGYWSDQIRISQPVDAWQPEAVTFTSLYANGLFAVSLALMLGILLSLMTAAKRRDRRFAVVAGFLGLILGNVHTYDVLTLAAVWTVYIAVRSIVQRRLDTELCVHAILAAALASPAVFYQLYQYVAEPTFRYRANVPTLSPPPSSYVLGYGLLLPLAAWTATRWLRANIRANPERLLILVWGVLGALLPYLPGLPFQRRLVMGLHVPLALLAGIALAEWVQVLVRSRTKQIAVALAIILFTAVTNVRFVARDVRLAVTRNRSASSVYPVYWWRELVDAVRWTRRNLPPSSIVYTGGITGVLVPALGGHVVFAGHWGETLQFGRKFREAFAFFNTPGADGRRGAYLRSHEVTHILAGPLEFELMGRPDFSRSPGLCAVYPDPLSTYPQTRAIVFRVRSPGQTCAD